MLDNKCERTQLHALKKQLEGDIAQISEISSSEIIIEEKLQKITPIHHSDLQLQNYLKSETNEEDTGQSEQANGEAVTQHAKAAMKPAYAYGGDIVLPDSEPKTMQEVLLRASQRPLHKGITYLREDGKEEFQSYADLLQEAQMIYNGLKKKGLKPGDHLIFQFNDNRQFISTFWACIMGGILPAPIGIAPIYTEYNAVINKLFNVWKLLDHAPIVTDRETVSSIKDMEKLWNEKIEILCTDDLKKETETASWFPCTPDDLYLNLLTSGSTGIPKCLQHPHKTTLFRNYSTSQFNQFTEDEVSLNWMPLDHVGGLVMFHIRDVYLGCSQILGKIDYFIENPLNWLNWIEKYKATLSWAPNFAFSMLNEKEEEIASGHWDLSSMRYLMNAAEAVVAKTCHKYLRILEPHGLRHDAIVPAYGMSETSSAIVQSKILSRNDELQGIRLVDKKTTSHVLKNLETETNDTIVFTEAGVPIQGVHIRIADEKNQLITEDVIGRLQVKSPTVMRGYLKNPEANAECFMPDGWFNTGDLAYMHDGKLIITGREKDVIILNGNNYYNYEIESVVEEVSGVEVTFSAACAVRNFGGVDSLAIFYVPENDCFEDIAHLIEVSKEIKQRVIRKIGINPAIVLPIQKAYFAKTNSGKIQRSDIAKAYDAGAYSEIVKAIDICSENENTLPDWIYSRTWSEQPLESKGDAINKRSSVRLIFETELDKHLNIPKAAKDIVVYLGVAFKCVSSNHYTVNPYEEADYLALFNDLADKHIQVSEIINLWSASHLIGSDKSIEALKNMQFYGSYHLMSLLHALSKVDNNAHIKLVYVTHASFGVHAEDKTNYAHGTLEGLIKTIPHEFKQLSAKQIDLTETDFKALGHIVTDELCHMENDLIVAYRNGKRYVQRLKKVDLIQNASNDLPLKPNGFYLVTGGLGGVGQILSKHLLEKYAADLLVVGRSPLVGTNKNKKTEVLNQLKQYESFGGQVAYTALDLTNKADIAKCIHTYEQQFGKELSGVIHLAGIVQELELKDQSLASLEEMYDSKVFGTVALFEAIKEKQLLFVTTSSARTLFSGMTVGAYSSGNGFIENFSSYTRRYPNIQTRCFAWSMWDDIGMGEGLIIKNLLESKGLSRISAEKGLLSFIVGLKCEEPLQFVGIDASKPDILKIAVEKPETCHQINLFYTLAPDRKPLEVENILKDKLQDSLKANKLGLTAKQVTTFPLLDDGTVDAKALLAMTQKNELNSDDLLPKSDTEKKLAQIWMGLLNQKSVKLSDNFFELGGHSLKATQMLSAVKKTFGVALELKSLFEKSDLQSLSELIEQSYYAPKENKIEKVDRTAYGNIFPMSSAQKRQWVLYEMEPDNPFYNNTVIMHLRGSVSQEAVEKSVQHIVDRHETLRTTFGVIDGVLSQTIQPKNCVFPEWIDLQGCVSCEREDAIKAIIEQKSMEAFNLETDSMLKYTVIKAAQDWWVMVVSIHHIVSDGWSVGVFSREFSKCYEAYMGGATPELPELPIQYADYAVWQKEWTASETYQKQLKYWESKLSGELPRLEMPIDKTRPQMQSYKGSTETLELDLALTEQLKAIGSKNEATLFMVLLAGFAGLMHRYTGQEDIVLGSLIANRNRSELEPLIGFFVNTLALRIQASGESTFKDWLQVVKQTTTEAYANQDVQFESLVDGLRIQRDASVHPIFQVLFILQNAPMESVQMQDTQMNLSIHYNETSKFDLSVQIFENENGLKVIAEYCTDLFNQETIARLLGHYRELLLEISKEKAVALNTMNILTAEEKKMFKKHPSNAKSKGIDKPVHEYFETAVEQYAARTALKYAGGTMTYDELNRRANQLARRLGLVDINPEDLVGICLDRSPEMVISIFAVLKAGGAYLPIDPEYPDDRIQYIVENSGLKLILTQTEHIERLKAFTDVIDVYEPRLYEGKAGNLNLSIDKNNLAYVIYTSGSTGNPKGVMVEHGSVSNIVTDLQEKYPLLSEDTFLLKTAYTFDVSVSELFGWFFKGGSLALLEKGGEKDPDAIVQAIKNYQVTHINFVPSMLNVFIDMLDEKDFEIIDQMKYVLAAGEAISRELVRKFYAKTQSVSLENLYGPTECTVYASYYPIGRGDYTKAIPIGKPMRHIHATVVDKYNNPVPMGIQGELCLSGIGLARGYLNNEALTQEKFIMDKHSKTRMYKTGDLVKWNSDGDIEYLGRIDHQVKIRGFRIELGEIEAVLNSNPMVKESVVVAADDEKGMKRLVAYVVWEAEADPNWRAFLKTKLTEYMIPSLLVSLPAIPLSANGKVDRKQLPAPALDVTEVVENYVKPRTENEAYLVKIWCEMLKLNQIGIEDDFFNLGGDSISAIQMIAKLKGDGYRLEPKVIFTNKTISKIAPYLKEAVQTQKVSNKPVTGETLLTPITHWFFEQNFEQPTHWNLPAVLELNKCYSSKAIEIALIAVINHHDMLRANVWDKDGNYSLFINNIIDEIAVEYYDLKAVPSAEQKTFMEAQGTALQSSFTFENGYLVKAAVFDCGEAHQKILLAVHHLIMDGISWRVVAEDFTAALESISSGKKVKLPNRTMSFKDWAQALYSYAQTETASNEAAYWHDVLNQVVPFQNRKEKVLESASEILEVSLDEETSRQLMTKCHHSYNTEMNDLLLSALANAYSKCTGKDTLSLALEGHGREAIIKDADISRTVGWFTTVFPVNIQSHAKDSLEASIKQTKELLRGIPNKGIGFGILKYLCDAPRTKALLNNGTFPSVCFNYLGNMDQADETMKIHLANRALGSYHSPDAHSVYELEINLMYQDHKLQIFFTHAKTDAALVQRMATAYTEELKAVVAHCMSAVQTKFTPSDFAMVSLTQEQVDRLPEGTTDVYPLSAMQQGMLYHNLMGEQDSSYNGQIQLSLSGTVDTDKMEQAWHSVIERHSILRTVYRWHGFDKPVQVVLNTLPIQLACYDHSALSNDMKQQKIAGYMTELCAKPFELETESSIRVALVKVSDTDYEMLWVFHHIALDGWSVDLVLTEVINTYNQMMEGTKLDAQVAPSYNRYIEWFEAQDKKEARQFWRKYLEGFRESTPLPGVTDMQTELPRSVIKHKTVIDETLKKSIELLAKQQNVTMNTLFQAAWGILLGYYTHSEDIVYGVTVSGRNPQVEEIDKMVGLFINSLPLRMNLSQELRFSELFAYLQETTTELKEYDYTLLSDIFEESELNAQDKLFKTLFIYQNFPAEVMSDQETQSIRVMNKKGKVDIDYDMVLEFTTGKEMTFEIYYNENQWDLKFIERMQGHLLEILQHMTVSDDGYISELKYLSADEETIILNHWAKNATVNYLYEDQEEVYFPINTQAAGAEIYVLNNHLVPVPVGIPGNVFISAHGADSTYESWPEWMLENAMPHIFDESGERKMYYTGDLGVWEESGTIKILDLA